MSTKKLDVMSRVNYVMEMKKEEITIRLWKMSLNRRPYPRYK